MKRPWRCRFGWHKWRRRFTDDNQRYVACARCGMATDDGQGGFFVS
jgi:hypothetical protein